MAWTLKKCQGQERQRKTEEMLQIKGDGSDLKTKRQHKTLDWFLDQKKKIFFVSFALTGISGTASEIQIGLIMQR